MPSEGSNVMRKWFVLVAVIVVMAMLEIVHPGNVVYRSDWLNIGIGLLTIVTLVQIRRYPASANVNIAMIFAAVVCAVATIGSGLFAPSPRIVAGAPGASVAIPAFGAVAHFPLLGERIGAVRVAGVGPVLSVASVHLASTLLFTERLHRVVVVSASDAVHGHLTVTQPTGQTFLSPVLLMRAKHIIDGINAPFDGFTLPAVHRNVKVIVFSPEQAAHLPFESRGGSGIFFIVTDDLGRTMANGITLARDGQLVSVAGLQLKGQVADFPDIRVEAIPFLPAVLLGGLAFLLACGVAWRPR